MILSLQATYIEALPSLLNKASSKLFSAQASRPSTFANVKISPTNLGTRLLTARSSIICSLTGVLNTLSKHARRLILDLIDTHCSALSNRSSDKVFTEYIDKKKANIALHTKEKRGAITKSLITTYY